MTGSGDLRVVLDEWARPGSEAVRVPVPASDPYGNQYPALDAAETIQRAVTTGFITPDEARYRLGMTPFLA